MGEKQANLIFAVQRYDEDAIKSLIENGADVNEKDKDGHTVLMFAVQCSNEKTIKFLIDKGADVNAKDKYGHTVLMFAIGRNIRGTKLSIVKLLIEAGSDIHERDDQGMSILMNVSGKISISFNRFFDIGLCVYNSPTSSRRQSLYRQRTLGTAVCNIPTYFRYTGNCENIEIAKILIELGADVNAKDKVGRTPLIFATEYYDNESNDIIKLLIESGADVNCKDDTGLTPLMYATKEHRVGIAKLLIESGADIQAKDKNGWTVYRYAETYHTTGVKNLLVQIENKLEKNKLSKMYEAAVKNDVETVRKLIDAGADINATDNYGWTPLSLAIKNDSSDVERLLIGAGADLLSGFSVWLTTKEHKTYSTANQYAYFVRTVREYYLENKKTISAKTEIELINDIVQSYGLGYEIFKNYGHSSARSALKAYLRFCEDRTSYKSASKREQFLKKTTSKFTSPSLRKLKKTLNNLTEEQRKALFGSLGLKKSVENQNTPSKAIQDYKTDISLKEDIGPFFKSAEANDTQKLQEILQSGIDINAKDNYGWTALMRAASKNAVETSRILIDAGADINAIDNCGWTALMDAVDTKSVDIVKQLIDAGAELEIKNNEGKTAIMLARGSIADTISILLKDAGAEQLSQEPYISPSAQIKEPEFSQNEEINKFVVSPTRKYNIPLVSEIHKFAKEKNIKVLLDIIQPDANIDISDIFGWTALMYAARENATDIAKLLINSGADINNRNKNSKTALDIARANKSEDVMKLLLDSGAK